MRHLFWFSTVAILFLCPPLRTAIAAQEQDAPDLLDYYEQASLDNYYWYFQGVSDAEKNQQPTTNPETSDRKNEDWWMVILTFGLVVVGFLQCRIYFTQCKLMQQTIDQSRIASEQALRAYVNIVFGPSGLPAPPDTVQAVITNNGQTPAYNLSSSFNWKWFAGRDVAWPVGEPYIDFAQPLSIVTLGPSASTPVGYYVLGVGELVRRADLGEITLYFYGTVSYTDAFRIPRWTNFCLQHVVGSNPPSAIAAGHHNDSN